uniref:Uncharacterized protein n=1 Tax=Glossina austeni TaxID=7395 RepID=A0A1A9UDN5_GLOAU
HVANLVIVQRQLLILITECIKAIKVKNGYEFEAVVQVLTFLCDVSSSLTSVKFKIAIESWHAVGTLSYTCIVLSKSFEAGKESLQNVEMSDWSMQPSLKILKEIKKCLQYLQEFVVLHISEDASAHFLGCNFIQDYLTICLENHYQQQYFITNNVKYFLQIFFKLFETPLIYADCRKYNEILEYYVVLMLLDSSYCLHQHFCKFVLEEEWILAFTSSQVLKIYYSYQHSNMEYNVVCLEFWMQRLAYYTVYKFNERKFFIQDLTKSLIARIPEHIFPEQDDSLRELLLFVNDKHNVSLSSFRLESDLQKLRTLNGNSMGVVSSFLILLIIEI